VTAVGAGWVFMINAASFAGMLVALSLIRTVELQPAPRAGRERGQIREGWKYVLSRPDILVELIVVFLIGTFGFNFPIFLSTMASVEFGQGASAFGVLSSILAIGSVAGALLAARRDRPRIGVTAVAALGFGVMCLIASIAPNYWTFAACLVLVGFCAMSTTTSANSYVQTTTEPLMRGRVMALYMAIFAGGTPIGAPLVGWVANSMGPRWALGLAALSGVAASAVALGWLIRARNFRVHRGSGWRAPLAVSYDGKRQTPEDVAALLSTQEIATQRG
jgi:MFS family permease